MAEPPRKVHWRKPTCIPERPSTSSPAPSPSRHPRLDIERRKPFGGGGSKQSLVRRDDDHRLIPPVLQRQRRRQVDPIEPTKGVALDHETGSSEHVFVETDPHIAGPVSFELLAGACIVSFFEDRKSPLATKPGPARLSGLARQNDPVKDQPASELPRRAFAPNVPESFPESAWPFSTRIPTGVRTDSGEERNFYSV